MFSVAGVVKEITTGKGLMGSVCGFIIRPPRASYEISDLGPETFRIGDDTQLYTRTDFELESMRGLTLQCSWFKMVGTQRQPCVIYLHANCGSRYDSLEALFLLKRGFSLFSLDTTGSGMSEGEYISLGFYERQDLAAAVEYLSARPAEVDGIGLWGRSMGAITSIMYAAKDSISIKCIVCDSPFSTLRLLIQDLVKKHGSKHIPSYLVNKMVDQVKKGIEKRAAFDIDDLDALKYARECNVPAFIFHGVDDDFVSPKHSMRIRDNFKGTCVHQLIPGGHNDERDDIEDVIAAFFTLYLVEKRAPGKEQYSEHALAPNMQASDPEAEKDKNQSEGKLSSGGELFTEEKISPKLHLEDDILDEERPEKEGDFGDEDQDEEISALEDSPDSLTSFQNSQNNRSVVQPISFTKPRLQPVSQNEL